MTLENYLGKILPLKDLINYQESAIVSKEILRENSGTITVFAFDKGQGLSEHTAPFNATVIVLEGYANVYINKELNVVKSGEMVIMPANVPHSLTAEERFKMLLIMIRG